MTIALMEIPASREALLLGHSAGKIRSGPCTGLPNWTRWTRWGELNLDSIAGWELQTMTWALYLGVFGICTNASIATAAVLFIRYYVSQPAMGFKIGHVDLWIGPVMLIMACTPAGDALSIDSALWWIGKTLLRRRSGHQYPHGFWTSVAIGMRHSCQTVCYRYGLALALCITYVGMVLLSAGYQKASLGPPYAFQWAFSDVFLIEMRTGWLKHMGRPYIPTLAQAGWNPFRVLFHSFLLPVIRIDKIPILLHIGSWIVMMWECTHWLLVLASMPVRYGAIAMDVVFHLSVSWFIGIPIFMPMAMGHMMLLPWDKIFSWAAANLSRPERVASLTQGDAESQDPDGGPTACWAVPCWTLIAPFVRCCTGCYTNQQPWRPVQRGRNRPRPCSRLSMPHPRQDSSGRAPSPFSLCCSEGAPSYPSRPA